MLRLGSTATTGGIGNPVVATFEHIMAFIGAFIAIWIPFIAATIFILAFGGLLYWWMKRRNKQNNTANTPQ